MDPIPLNFSNDSDEARGDAEPPLARPRGGEPLQIGVANQQTRLPIDEAALSAAVRLVIQCTPPRTASISIAVVDDATIRELNRQFLQHDYATDVLSFTLEDLPEYLEGEIVVSADTAVRNADNVDWSPNDELLLYVVHGALHLAGYQDKRPADARAMRAAEAEILTQLGVERSVADSRWFGEINGSADLQHASADEGGITKL